MDGRAYALREGHVRVYGCAELGVVVDGIAEHLLGLHRASRARGGSTREGGA